MIVDVHRFAGQEVGCDLSLLIDGLRSDGIELPSRCGQPPMPLALLSLLPSFLFFWTDIESNFGLPFFLCQVAFLVFFGLGLEVLFTASSWP